MDCDLPCYYYQLDSENPRFMRFVEARSVRIQKKVLLTLSRGDTKSCADFMSEFCNTAHFKPFLFVGKAKPVQSWACAKTTPVKAFKMDAKFQLQEELDEQEIFDAWHEYKGSPLITTSISEKIVSEDFISKIQCYDESLLQDLHRVSRDLCLRQYVPSSCSLEVYTAARRMDEQLPPDSSWDLDLEGRMKFFDACNMYSSYVEIPILVPNTGVLFTQWDYSTEAEENVYHNTSVFNLATNHPDMPFSEYLDALLRARFTPISVYKEKSMTVTQTLDDRIFGFKNGSLKCNTRSVLHRICDEDASV